MITVKVELRLRATVDICLEVKVTSEYSIKKSMLPTNCNKNICYIKITTIQIKRFFCTLSSISVFHLPRNYVTFCSYMAVFPFIFYLRYGGATMLEPRGRETRQPKLYLYT